jgi:hypothetical protein
LENLIAGQKRGEKIRIGRMQAVVANPAEPEGFALTSPEHHVTEPIGSPVPVYLPIENKITAPVENKRTVAGEATIQIITVRVYLRPIMSYQLFETLLGIHISGKCINTAAREYEYHKPQQDGTGKAAPASAADSRENLLQRAKLAMSDAHHGNLK